MLQFGGLTLEMGYQKGIVTTATNTTLKKPRMILLTANDTFSNEGFIGDFIELANSLLDGLQRCENG